MYFRFTPMILLVSLSIILILTLPNSSLLQAQELCSLPTRLTPNMPGRVRAVSTAGNNLRANAGLESEVVSQLANGSEFIVQSPPVCVDGLNWYEIKTQDAVIGWTAEGSGELYWLEPIPFCAETHPTAQAKYRLDETSGDLFGHIVAVQYVPARKSLLLMSQGETQSRPLHPAVLTYHWFNLETQAVTPAEYPDADIITPALTDKLGITDYVFGDKSQEYESIYVSPRRDRILYFTYNPPVEGVCAHGCFSVQLWVADLNGSNAVSIGSVVTGDAGYIAWEWGSNGRIYLTMVYLDGSLGVVELCEDGSCTNHDGFPHRYAFPAFDPNGDYIAFAYTGWDTTGQPGKLFHLATGSWFDLPLVSLGASAIWADDGQTIYHIGLSGEQTVLAATPLDDLNRADVLVDGFASGLFRIEWDIAPDLGLAFIINDHHSLDIYCMNT